MYWQKPFIIPTQELNSSEKDQAIKYLLEKTDEQESRINQLHNFINQKLK